MDISREDGHGTCSNSNATDSDGSDGTGNPPMSDDDGPFEPMDDDFHQRSWGAHRPEYRSRGWRDYFRSSLHAPSWLRSLSKPSQPNYVSVGSENANASSPGGAMGSLREIMFSSKLNALIVFVPIGVATYLTKCPPPWIFGTNAMAIIPLSALLTDATERIAADAGDTIGALLNISLGNLVELILFVALANGHVRIVESSILGSILVNILLILGSALLACSLIDTQTVYGTAGTQILGCLLFVSVFVFLMPTAFQSAFHDKDNTDEATLMMSRITACVVLAIYMLYIYHELKTPQRVTDASSFITDDSEAQQAPPSMTSQQGPMRSQAISTLVMPQRTIRFADEQVHDGHAEYPKPELRIEMADVHGRTGPTVTGDVPEDPGMAGRSGAGAPASIYSTRGRSISLESGAGRPSRESSMGSDGIRALMRSALPTRRAMRTSLDGFGPVIVEAPSKGGVKVNRAISILVLIVSSGLMSMNAEFLVSTIDQITHEGHLSEAMIGLIILPIVGNMAEYITVVTVAVREKLDLAIAVSVGSSIQIALCVAPLTVLAGWILDRDLLLTFNFFEMATLVGTVLLVNIIILSESSGGSTSNALRGGLVCGCYAIIGIGAYLAPE